MDVDYNELFGLEDEEESMEDTNQEDEEEVESEEENDLEDEPASDDESEADESEEDTESQTIGNPGPQDQEQARRAAQAAADKAVDDAFKNSGLVNPYTKQPITSKEEYEAYRQRFEEDRKANILKKSGLSEEELKQFIESQPDVKAAKEAQAKAEEEANRAREQQARQRVEAQIKEIAGLDPSIKSINDLTKMESYPKFYEMVKAGYSLSDAFKLVNFDRLTKHAADGARQAARNSVKSKQHLGRTAGRGKGSVSVPESVKETYRMMMPDITDAEIHKHFQVYKSKKGE